jgi:tetratricopeptide (TPR) repeat protein
VLVRHLGADHPDLAAAFYNVARLKRDQKDYAAAEKSMRESVRIAVKALGADHPSTALFGTGLGHVLVLEGQFNEAEPLLLKGLAAAEAASNAVNARAAAELLVNLYVATGRPADADTYRRKLAAAPPEK